MEVVICEDEQYWIDALRTSISTWATARNTPLACHCFVSPYDLLNHLANNQDAEVVFLDISLGEEVIDGMALAKRIRKLGNMIPIIFVTVDSHWAADGYLVEAMGFLQKPVDNVRLALFLDRIVKQHHKQKAIRLTIDSHTTCIYLKDIVYVEIIDHTVTYHTRNGSFDLRSTLGEVLSLLSNENFMQVHRSYVIALNKIDSIKTTYPYSVTLRKELNNTIDLPVSRKLIRKLLDAYSDDVLERMI